MTNNVYANQAGELEMGRPPRLPRLIDETIRWRSVKDEYPDADTTVLLYDPELNGETVWPGAWDDHAQEWVIDGFPCEPTHWAPMPAGPASSGNP